MLFFSKNNSHTLIDTQAIHSFILQFAKKDNWHNLDTKNGNLGYGWLHYANIRNLRPKRVLCIGSRYGYIPAICAMACKDNRYGTVDFVDADYDMKKNDQNNWGGLGVWSKIRPAEYFQPMQDFITLHIMDTKDFFKTHSNLTWDYCHIDGDHSYTGVSYDFERCWLKLKPGGLCCLHDINSHDGKNPYGVLQLWNELKKTKNYNMIEFPGPYGLGMIQK